MSLLGNAGGVIMVDISGWCTGQLPQDNSNHLLCLPDHQTWHFGDGPS
jgi:hypothetical protein